MDQIVYKKWLITQCLRYIKIYQSLYPVNMVCSLRAHLSGIVYGIFMSATHSDSPTKVNTYDFIRRVSLSGHSQYLAACAKMTPWQRDCKMPSTRMGALVGTPIWAANKDKGVMMWGRLVPAAAVMTH